MEKTALQKTKNLSSLWKYFLKNPQFIDLNKVNRAIRCKLQKITDIELEYLVYRHTASWLIKPQRSYDSETKTSPWLYLTSHL